MNTKENRATKCSELRDACQSGKEASTVLKLLAQGIDPNDVEARDCESGKNPLHYACQHGWVNVVQQLIDVYKCNPEVRANGRGECKQVTPLHIACEHGEIEVAKLLIEKYQCNPNVEDSLKLTPLHYACKNGKVQIAKLLIETYQCDPNVRDSNGMTPLHCHAASQNTYHVTSVAKILVTHGADPDAADVCDGNTPLHIACQAGRLTTVEYLLEEARCNPNIQNKAGLTPLQVSSPDVWCIHLLLKELVSHGASLDVVDSDGNTPLHIACQAGSLDAVKYLLESGNCDPNFKNKAGLTSLQVTSPPRTDLVKELITHGADYHHVADSDGNTPLHISCKAGGLDTVKYLLENGKCDPNLKNTAGLTPLQVTDPWRTGLLKELITHGADYHHVADKDGNTPLHIACQKGDLDLVKCFLKVANCDLNVRNSAGLTPLQVIAPGKTELLDELITHGANPNDSDSEGNTLLHKACQAGSVNTVKYLLKVAKCDPNLKNKAGLTPVQVTCTSSSNIALHLITELVTYGAKLDVVDGDGNTLLHIACQAGSQDAVKYLLENGKCDPNLKNTAGLTPLQVTDPWRTGLLKELVTHGADYHHVADEVGNTPLHVACEKGDLNSVKCFLKVANCDLNVKNNAGLTPLQVIAPVKTELLDELITHGANPNDSDSEGNTLLHKACQAGSVNTVEYLLKAAKCEPNLQNKAGLTPLQVTSSNEIVLYLTKELITHVTNPNESGSDGHTLLHIACQAGSVDTVKYLLESGKCDPNLKNTAGLTPLQVTSPWRTDIFVELVTHGADYHHVADEDGNTPLHVACQNEDLDSVKCFLEVAKCVPNIKNEAGLTPLQVIAPGKTELLSKLIAHGANPNDSDSEGNTLLHKACQAGSVNTVKYLLKVAKCNPNLKNKAGLTPVQVASPSGIDFSLLIEHGARFDVVDGDGNTLLHKACQAGSLDTVKYLLKVKKCDPNPKNKAGLTPLQVTSPSGRIFSFLIIQCHGTDLDVVDSEGNTLLHIACQEGQLATVKYLLENGKCDPNLKNKAGLTPLQVTDPWRTGLLKELITHGADYHHVADKDGNTPLHIACQKGDLDSVKCFLKVANCDLNVRNNAGLGPLQMTPRHLRNIIKQLITNSRNFGVVDRDGNNLLHIACRDGELESVKCLLSIIQCDPNAKNNAGLTPLQVISPWKTDVLKEMILHGANYHHITDKDGNTPLHIACQKGDINSVMCFLKVAKCNPNVKNKAGLTPLQVTPTWRTVSFVKELIAHGADSDLTDAKGNTPLHTACRAGELNLVRCLLDVAKCNPNIKNKDGLTPLQVICPHRNDLVRELLRYGADPNVADSRNGNTPLHIACKSGELNSVKHLLNVAKCDPNIKNEEGLTPLQTISPWRTDLFRKMVNRGANANVADSDGNTQLHNACRFGSLDSVQYLLEVAKCDPNAKNNVGLAPLQVTTPGRIHFSIVKELVAYGANPDLADSKGNTLLHIACWAGRLGSVKCLLDVAKCDPDPTNKYGLTPLQLTPPRLFRIIQQLVKHGAKYYDVIDHDGNTPLHNACYASELDAVLCFLEVTKCDPNAQNKAGLTPLQIISPRCTRLVEELVKHGANSCAIDNDGNTPLHNACQQNCIESVKHLLTAADCDANVKNKDGLTPLQVTSFDSATIITELIRHGANAGDVYRKHKIGTVKQPLQPPVKVFVVGNASAGKSTLTAALQKESSFFERIFTSSQKVTGVDTKTAGVVPHEFESREYGRITFYDFAGQREFYGSHGALLESAISLSPSIFLIVVKLSESEDDITRTLLYWLTFLENHCTTMTSKPHIIIIGSHADVVKKRGEDLGSKCNHLKPSTEIPYSKFVFAGIIPMDCQYPESHGMTELRQCLKTSCDALRPKKSISFNAHCFYVYLQDKFRNSIAVTVDQIQAEIKRESSSHSANVTSFVPDSLYPLCKICSELNDRGHILFLKDSLDIRQSLVVIDKKCLLAQVSGSIFAPEDFTQHKTITQCTCSTGVVPLSSITKYFPGLSPKLLMRFLSCLEFCREICDPEILHHITAEHQKCLVNEPSKDVKEQYYLFPALVSVNVPPNIWNDNTDYKHNFGWILSCSTERPEQFFTPRFLQVLILRLAATYPFPLPEKDKLHSNPAIQRNCSIWKNGLFWGNDCGVETLVEVLPDNKAVIVLMRCRETALVSMVQLRSQVLRQVLKAVEKFCKGISTVESFIDPSQCKQYPLKQLSQLKLFSISSTVEAMVESKTAIVSPSGSIFLENLIQCEPYVGLGEDILWKIFESQGHRSKTVTDNFLLQFAEAKTGNPEQFIKLFGPEHENTASGVLSILKTWRAGCAGTYKCLREKLDEFSVLAGRNPLSLAGMTIKPQSAKENDLPEIPLSLKSFEPTLQQLQAIDYNGKMIKVIEHVAGKWKKLAIALGFEHHVVEYLSKDFSHDSVGAATEVFIKWLDGGSNSDQPVTWDTLIQCLFVVDKIALAKNLVEALTDLKDHCLESSM